MRVGSSAPPTHATQTPFARAVGYFMEFAYNGAQTGILTSLDLKTSALNEKRTIHQPSLSEIQQIGLKVEVLPQEGLREKDKITMLSGQPGKVNFDQYGGYVTVDKQTGRALYYYFAEADDPKNDSMPLVLWLNGGITNARLVALKCDSVVTVAMYCRSWLFFRGVHGAFAELGPFRVSSDGKTLYENEYAWNKGKIA
ncbi:hypothetical protein HHK36_017793 [Tetracentron sinense]|uniref:Uncharacterized protein n=1 Tax=Tetracentron sinense TaxID=13715 RepID=A0A834YYS7_TETSI|nr:hypothetical protein HHK36_017793 [Tetracentron sinense]